MLHDVITFCSHADRLTKEAVHTSPTIGSNVEQITVRKTHFLVWDIGGQESLRASWYSYYGNTEVRKETLMPPHTLKQRNHLMSVKVQSKLKKKKSSSIFQIVILVVDSTDRERLGLTKEELHRMLSHEVRGIYQTVWVYDPDFALLLPITSLLHTSCTQDVLLTSGAQEKHKVSIQGHIEKYRIRKKKTCCVS